MSDQPEFLTCKACGCQGLVPAAVEFENEEHNLPDVEFSEVDRESRFYRCRLCGDNWFSMKQVSTDGVCRISFLHQTDVEPGLRRVALMATEVILNERTVETWEHFIGDQSVSEEAWHAELKTRRNRLRAACCN